MQPESETTRPVGAELLSDAKNIGTTAANRLHSEVDARKSDAVTQVNAVSSTIERAAEGLDANAPSWLKSAFEQGAQQVKSFAETLDQNDSRQISAQVTAFAKRSPVTFLGACAAVGFAAARVFKAGNGENAPTQTGSLTPARSMSPTSADFNSISGAMTAGTTRGELV